jgi:hypothetical protein
MSVRKNDKTAVNDVLSGYVAEILETECELSGTNEIFYLAEAITIRSNVTPPPCLLLSFFLYSSLTTKQTSFGSLAVATSLEDSGVKRVGPDQIAWRTTYAT